MVLVVVSVKLTTKLVVDECRLLLRLVCSKEVDVEVGVHGSQCDVVGVSPLT